MKFRGLVSDLTPPAAFDTLTEALAAVEADSASRDTPPASFATWPTRTIGSEQSIPVSPAQGA